MAISNAAELRIGVKNTQVFIDANYIEVQIKRPRHQRTEAGGVRKIDPTVLDPQRFRIVPMSGLVWDRSRPTPDEGRVPDVTEILIGLPDADVAQDDYFPAEHGGFYEIVHCSPVRGYRRECRLRWSPTEPKA